MPSTHLPQSSPSSVQQPSSPNPSIPDATEQQSTSSSDNKIGLLPKSVTKSKEYMKHNTSSSENQIMTTHKPTSSSVTTKESASTNNDNETDSDNVLTSNSLHDNLATWFRNVQAQKQGKSTRRKQNYYKMIEIEDLLYGTTNLEKLQRFVLTPVPSYSNYNLYYAWKLKPKMKERCVKFFKDVFPDEGDHAKIECTVNFDDVELLSVCIDENK